MKKLFGMMGYLLMTCALQAQSYHFSQLYSAPIMVNPANTGYFPGDVRVSMNFRSQWAADKTPYITTALGGEYRLLRDKLPETSQFGVGVTFMNDQSMARAVQSNGLGAAVGYHIGLDGAGIHSLGIGVHGTFTQRRIDISRLSFENQFGSGGYDPSLPIGEDIGSTRSSFFDVNAGLMYHANFENKSYFLGAAVFNSFQHTDNMLDEQFKMPMRFSVQGGASFDVDPDSRIYFSALSQRQAEVQETTIGAAYGRQMMEGMRDRLFLGLWYRLGDAVFPYLGYQIGGFRGGLSMDVTMSKAKSASSLRNAIELSLVFSPWDVFEKSRLSPWY